MLNYSIEPLGDQALIVEFGNKIDPSIYENVQRLTHLLEETKPTWLIEYIPAYTTVTIFYDVLSLQNDDRSPFHCVQKEIERLLQTERKTKSAETRLVEIPVCYGGEFGPDLSYVASYNDLTEDEVISIHSSGEYIVYMLGFAPGFPYIGGMSPKIATPRKESPRLAIPARSVGIAGGQTGIYPIETPGGWQLIGKTPLPLFNRDKRPPTLLQAGDRIRFVPITYEQFRHMEEQQNDYGN